MSDRRTAIEVRDVRKVYRRWARERHRIALHYEDDAGVTAAWTYWDLQQKANRLSNALKALGVKRGDRRAVLQPVLQGVGAEQNG